jgi:ADP-ribose pyrophosphatase
MNPDASRTEFDGKMLRLVVEEWDEREYEIVERADSVAVVAVDRDGCVVLVRQFRPPVRGELLELPAGTVDEGEDPETTARRELEEEVGLRGGRWEVGPVVYSTPGFCRERIHFFFAEALEPASRSADVSEEIEIVRWGLDEAVGRLGELEDVKTLAGLLLYLRARR